MAPGVSCLFRKTSYRAFSYIQRRMMASSSGQSHLERTQDNSRQQLLSAAKVVDVSDLSPSVKTLTLEVENRNFFFKPGQWLDMMIPGVDTVGGYSMTSTPDLLNRQQRLELAVKYSKHPPAYWVHTKCKQGDKVAIRAGGDFFYYPDKGDANKDVLLLAGGVGINPLYSILQHFVQIHQQGESSEKPPAPCSNLLFSAQTKEDLIFKSELLRLADANACVQVKFFCTQEKGNSTLKNQSSSLERRICDEDVNTALNTLTKSRTHVYICGPGSFIKSMESFCLEAGVSQENIFYETWW